MKTYSEQRPWGGFQQFTNNEKTTVKILTIKPGQQFSLQLHEKREEFWKFLDNEARVTIGEKTFIAKKGDELFIAKNTLQRIQALQNEVNVLEVAYGEFDESDIKRIEDAYGRVK